MPAPVNAAVVVVNDDNGVRLHSPPACDAHHVGGRRQRVPTAARVRRAGQFALEVDVDSTGDVSVVELAAGSTAAKPPSHVENDRGSPARTIESSAVAVTAVRRRSRSPYSRAVTARLAFIRGINLGRNAQVPMAELREALAAGGFTNVRTYIQSGNVVYDAPPGVAIRRQRCATRARRSPRRSPDAAASLPP